MTAPPVTLTEDGRSITVTFDAFGLEAYALFLRTKSLPEHELAYDWETDAYTLTTPARFAHVLGSDLIARERHQEPLADHLFDYQRFVVQRALDGKRFAAWLDTGLGKGPVILEWCRQVVSMTGGKVLIIEPLAVIEQLRAEAVRFYGDALPIERLNTREDVTSWCKEEGSGIAICNPQKFITPRGQVDGVMHELRYLAGVALDESSLLKSGGGDIKWNLIKSCRGIEYKLSATATPAPNDTMEYASQAAWLEKLRNEGDILWTYFSKDANGEWHVKPHARDAFYKFMASWSIYMRDPAHFGFADILSTLPPPEIHEYQVPITDAQQAQRMDLATKSKKGMFNDRMGVQERSRLSQLAKGFQYNTVRGKKNTALVESNKPQFVADLIRRRVTEGKQVLVATVFDEESAILADLLSIPMRHIFRDLRIGILTGSMTDEARENVYAAFKNGHFDVLISKSQLVGFGLNMQFCRSIVFSGFDDSFERMYQFVRRAYRFGQTQTVTVDVPYVPELEGMIFENVMSKEAQFMKDVEAQEAEYRKAMEGVL